MIVRNILILSFGDLVLDSICADFRTVSANQQFFSENIAQLNELFLFQYSRIQSFISPIIKG